MHARCTRSSASCLSPEMRSANAHSRGSISGSMLGKSAPVIDVVPRLMSLVVDRMTLNTDSSCRPHAVAARQPTSVTFRMKTCLALFLPALTFAFGMGFFTHAPVERHRVGRRTRGKHRIVRRLDPGGQDQRIEVDIAARAVD